MKRCTYCGQEYSDEYVVCRIDQKPLQSCQSQSTSTSDHLPQETELSVPLIDHDLAEAEAPERFQFLGLYEPFEAKQLLRKFEAAGVRFRVDLDRKRVFSAGGRVSGAGYVRSDSVKIFVMEEDEQKASAIISADWKV